MNLVEVFFSIITRKAIRRGSFVSVKELTTAIRTFIASYNTDCKPFTWTKPAEVIISKAGSHRRTTFTKKRNFNYSILDNASAHTSDDTAKWLAKLGKDTQRQNQEVCGELE